MKNRSLATYFAILATLCAAIIGGAKLLGERGAYLAQAYMLTPALATLFTRLFFYEPRFKDANLRFGRAADYFKFWLFSLGLTALMYTLYTILGAVRWDFTGDIFLERFSQQLQAAGQDINSTLPPGFTPQMMLALFTIGGVTVFNIFPGVITGFGEEFGHRGFMFPLLYRIKPWVGLVLGGLLWYAWHWPLLLVIPQTADVPFWQAALNWVTLAIGSVCTFIYLAYVYVKSESVFVTSIAHIVMNNAAASLGYYVVVENQVLGNIGTMLAMMMVIALLYYIKELNVFAEYFGAAVNLCCEEKCDGNGNDGYSKKPGPSTLRRNSQSVSRQLVDPGGIAMHGLHRCHQGDDSKRCESNVPGYRGCNLVNARLTACQSVS